MIEGCTILCFASGCEAPPKSRHHVMHLLAERNTVLWVNYHASRAQSSSAADLSRIVRKLGQVFGGVKDPQSNLCVLTLLILALPGRARAMRLNRWLPIGRIRAALSRLGGRPGADLVVHPRHQLPLGPVRRGEGGLLLRG